MRSYRFGLAATLAVVLLAHSKSFSQEPIRFGRTPDLSPDGRQVAFSYLGDIWIVETIGGIARPVTMHEAHDIYPVFSPDGRWIAFSSNRHGSYDVFVVPVQGGKPRRLTFDSAADFVQGWSPDGKQVLFSSNRGIGFPPAMELYTVPVEGGRERQVTHVEAKQGSFSPKGDRLAIVRGQGSMYRKGYRGSSNDDIWLCNADGTGMQQVTDFVGQDHAPMWAPDGQSLFYVSECISTPANIVRQSILSKSKPEPITAHRDDAVRNARMSHSGEWIVYECGADLWVVSTHGGLPRKLAIEVHADDKTNTERTVSFSEGASEFALSPDERHIAFVIQGEVFLMPSLGGKATRLTNNPANDHGVSWSPDGKKLVYLSDAKGFEDIYILESDEPEQRDFTRAKRFKSRQLTHTPEAESGVSFAPDGKRIGFLRAGKLWTMTPEGTEQKPLVDETQVFDYEWSPDSKYIVYARRDASFASDLYIIPSTGGESKNITRYATSNSGVTWAAKARKLAFISERRRNEPSVFVLSLQKPAAPNAVASSDIDWEDIHLRIEQPTPMHVEEAAISADGSRVAFRAVSQGSEDLWMASSDGSRVTRITSGNQRPTQIQWSKSPFEAIYFRDRTGAIRVARPGSLASEMLRLSGGSGSSEPSKIPFTAKMTVRREEQLQEMFVQSWRGLYEEFYDPQFHGVDWTLIREKYKPLVQHIAMKEDFYSLISMMLGELNASHLGIEGQPTRPEEVTAELGLLFDDSYTGPGLKVAEVLKRGPADKRGIAIKTGDLVLNIDGTEITPQVNLSKLLNAKVNENIALFVASNAADLKSRRRVELQGSGRESVRDLMYERWVEHNAQHVAAISKGKLGYIHIRGMDEDGLDQFVRHLYSDNYDKDAIVLDVRYNGGGFTHDQVLNYLGGREHTLFRHRDGGQGLVMRSFDRKWTKPLVLLINNRSYSDAEIFPSAFRTLQLGKLVGEPTGAQVIGTSGTRLIDGTRFRLPMIGVYTMSGTNMEREGVQPDVLITPHPEQLAKGQDAQLDKAVEIVTQDVVAWKKTRSPTPARLGETKTTAVLPAGTTK